MLAAQEQAFESLFITVNNLDEKEYRAVREGIGRKTLAWSVFYESMKIEKWPGMLPGQKQS
jgi:hypothetical protein